jgi:acyl phosphate:glycerol-3-phosphate acyltransferase
MTIHLFFFLVGAYLLGAIPFGLIFVKWAGLGDVRDIGSGNIGTTNVLRTGKKSLAILTLGADLLKGMVFILLAKQLELSAYDQVLIAASSVIGHIYPVWLKFQGGKGVATALGTLIGLMPILGILVALTWVTFTFIARISSLSALIAFIASPLLAFVIAAPDEILIYCMGISFLILWTHRGNIRRLSRGEEGALTFK